MSKEPAERPYRNRPSMINPEGKYEYPESQGEEFAIEESRHQPNLPGLEDDDLTAWVRQKTLDINAMVLRKRQRYGTSQINIYGLDGVGVHLLDKSHRFYNQRQEMGDQELADHLTDTIGYALIGLALLERGEW